MKSNSYKISFVFAVLLHLTIFVLLIIKFVPPAHHFVTNANIVQASVVSSSVLNKPAPIAPPAIQQQKVEPPKPIVQPTPIVPPQPIVKPKPIVPPKPSQVQPQPDIAKQAAQEKLELAKQLTAKKQAAESLKKHLAAEQAKELASLKRQIQTTKKVVAAKNQQKQAQIMQQTMDQQLAAERNQLATAQTAQMQGEIDKYKAMIIQAISAHWIIPDGVDNNATCQLLVSIAPGGAVLNVQLVSSSGNALLDRSAQTAVLKASPLPVPEAPELFNEFRSIKLKVRPEGIVTN